MRQLATTVLVCIVLVFGGSAVGAAGQGRIGQFHSAAEGLHGGGDLGAIGRHADAGRLLCLAGRLVGMR